MFRERCCYYTKTKCLSTANCIKTLVDCAVSQHRYRSFKDCTQNKLKLLPNELCLESGAAIILKQNVYPQQTVLKRLSIALLANTDIAHSKIVHRTLGSLILTFPGITELRVDTSGYIFLHWIWLLDLLYENKSQSDACPLEKISVHQLDCTQVELLVWGLYVFNPVYIQQVKCLRHIDLSILMNQRENLTEELSDAINKIVVLLERLEYIGGALKS
eukprot:332752_1